MSIQLIKFWIFQEKPKMDKTFLTRSRDKRWILEEIFVSTVNYIKWNMVGRISVTLLDGIMRVIDPVVTFLLPRGSSTLGSILLSAVYKKLQFFLMYWFNSLFFYM